MPDDEERESLGLSLEDSINFRASLDAAAASADFRDPLEASSPPSPPYGINNEPSNEPRSLGGGAFQVLRSISRGMLGMSSSPSPEKVSRGTERF